MAIGVLLNIRLVTGNQLFLIFLFSFTLLFYFNSSCMFRTNQLPYTAVTQLTKTSTFLKKILLNLTVFLISNPGVDQNPSHLDNSP